MNWSFSVIQESGLGYGLVMNLQTLGILVFSWVRRQTIVQVYLILFRSKYFYVILKPCPQSSMPGNWGIWAVIIMQWPKCYNSKQVLE